MRPLMAVPGLLASIPSPGTNAIHLGPLQLRAYGLSIAIGAIVALSWSQRRWAARGGDPSDVSRLATWSIAGGLIGARAYHVITDHQRFEGRWLHVFAVWEGGLGIPGGLLAGVLTGVVLARRRGLPAARLLDVVAPAIPVAQAIGRLGNWFNQELFGRPTNLPWGLQIDPGHRPAGYEQIATYHPTFLYEALWNLALAGVLVLYERRRPDARPGRLFALYVAGYGIGRLWVEALRIDPASQIAGVRVNIWVSALTIALSVAWLVRDRLRQHHATTVEEPTGATIHSAHESHEGHTGHGGHGDHAELFRRKFWLSLTLTVPVVIYSHMLMELTGWDPPGFSGDHWIPRILGTAVFAYAGPVFLTAGWGELRSRRPGMMLLISLGLLVAFGASAATTLGLLDVDLWPELATLVTIMLLGHWIEMRALGQAQGALAALAALLPDEAERVTDAGIMTVRLSELTTGDVVLVRPGGRVPADGEILEGDAEIDESMVTGESRPVAKRPGDRVVAGTVATDTSIRVRVDAVGDDTALAGIQRLVAEAEASKSRAQALADRAAALLFYVAVASGVVTFVVWSLLGETNDAFVRTVTVLVIACPHALGLAIPLVISLSTSISAKAGILVKDRMALERMRTIDTVIFDKTGTLTAGHHIVTGMAATEGSTDDEVLALAGAVEADSEHPLARAIVAAASAQGATAVATGFRSITGRGVEATVDGVLTAVGGPALLRQRELGEPASISAAADQWRTRGAAVLYVLRDDQIIGALALEDEIRPESRQAVDDLHRLGVRVVMITGDARQVADAVGAALGIDEVFAEVLPEDKDRAVTDLQARGLKVAMVGDGVNDAPALARADVGIAIGAGTDVAIESAGVVLASSDPRSVIGVIRLSRASYRKMLQNLTWGAGYNLLAIPLAAGVFAFAGLTLSPAVGAILMSASTVVVALNAQLLRRVDLRPGPAPSPEATAEQERVAH